MDEKKKETEQEKLSDTVISAGSDNAAEKIAEAPAEEQPEAADTSAASVETGGGAPVKKIRSLRNALIRAGCALIAAALLLAVTRLSIFDILKGPLETNAAQHEEMGSFVKQQVYLLLGDLSDQGLSGNYMLAAVVDKIVVVHFTDRYLDSAGEIKNDTLKFIDGDISTIDKYVTVEGTIEEQSEDLSGKLYEWFDANKSWMEEKGVIAQSSDAATYLSDAVLEVDSVNSMNKTLVYVLTGISALCLIYMIIELVLMAAGFYLPDRKSKKNGAVQGDDESDEKSGSEDNAAEAFGTEDDADEKTPLDGAECINTEEKPEDNDGTGAASGENTETQEDK